MIYHQTENQSYDIINLLADVGGGIVTTKYIEKLFDFYSRIPCDIDQINGFNAKVLLLAEIPSTNFNSLVYYSMLYKYTDTLELLYKYYSNKFSIKNLKDAILLEDVESFKYIYYNLTVSLSMIKELNEMVKKIIVNTEKNYPMVSVVNFKEINEFLKFYSEQ